MTKLYIDTADRSKRYIELNGVRKDFEGDLLVAIDELLKEGGVKLEDLTKIDVNKGPGSFTSLRVGISVANTLNYTLGLKSPKEIDLPEYGKEPNITKPKRSL